MENSRSTRPRIAQAIGVNGFSDIRVPASVKKVEQMAASSPIKPLNPFVK